MSHLQMLSAARDSALRGSTGIGIALVTLAHLLDEAGPMEQNTGASPLCSEIISALPNWFATASALAMFGVCS
jgi:hypothetical protein